MTTATGQPCKAYAMAGSNRCSSHLRIAHRKTSLTPRVTDEIALMLRRGVPVGVACAAVNVSRATYYRWLERDEPLYVQFRERVGQAQAKGELALVLDVLRAGRTEWRACAWLLERTKPEQFGRVIDRPAAVAVDDRDLFAVFAATIDEVPA
jgi:hypothetical protein